MHKWKIVLHKMIVECPHCRCLVEIEQMNCMIFRHAAYKDTGLQIPPHSSKELCEKLFAEGAVYGCAKPFILVQKNGKIEASSCEYI